MQITRTISIVLVFSLASVCYVKQNHAEIADKQLDNRVELSNTALKRLFEAGGPSASEIRSMLSKRDVVELEKILDSYFRKYQSDVRYELMLQDAYNVFSPAYNISPADLDYWASKTNSYMAFAARGGYKKALGFVARGSKTIHDTPNARIEDMIELHREAAKDLQTAVNKNPLLMPAYVYLIAIAKASPMPFTPKRNTRESGK